MQGNSVSVERLIKAPAREIFALLADAGRHSSFDGSGTVDHAIAHARSSGASAHARSSGASAASIPLELGTTFSMRMRGRPETLFMPYTTSSKVVEFEPDRRISWQSTTLGGLVGGRIWRYELTPTEDGTLVRETWDVSEDRQRPMLKMGSMPRHTEDGMNATLARIAALVET